MKPYDQLRFAEALRDYEILEIYYPMVLYIILI
jgi:hypothetical protein